MLMGRDRQQEGQEVQPYRTAALEQQPPRHRLWLVVVRATDPQPLAQEAQDRQQQPGEEQQQQQRQQQQQQQQQRQQEQQQSQSTHRPPNLCRRCGAPCGISWCSGWSAS